MNYQIILPGDDLKSYIRYFWILENNSLDQSAKTFKIISDGCPGIIFQDNYADKGNYIFPKFFLYGQTTRHSHYSSTGKFSTIGIYFYPDAIQSIFGIDAYEFTDHDIDMDLITGRSSKDLVERLLSTHSAIARVEILSSFLNQILQQNKIVRDKQLLFALSFIQEGRGDTAIREIQADLNISSRTLERRFKHSIGISPKLFARINRFQSSLDQLRNGNFRVFSDIAYSNNYSDQSHFIRDFKEFSGMMPGQFIRQTHELVENFPEIVL